ncbi:MAG: ubiquinone/menaquinone biosynthesis methyltransferase [Desulfarculus sp.]|nr:ubiquinone/menaquinone biosynthesis methyltransferase [Desulfarculus sp.]
MRDEAEQIRQVRRIFNRVVPVYDLLNRVLSLREDVRWRRFVSRSLRLGPGAKVLDVATGTGDLALAVATHAQSPLVVGLDLVPAMLGPAQKKQRTSGARLALLAGDGTKLPFAEATFDAVTIAFGIRNIPRRVAAMAEMKRVLKPGGRLYVLEFTAPQGRLVRALYLRYLARLLPWLGGLISGDQASYRYLAETIVEFPSPAEFRAEMCAAGLIAPRSHALTRGIAWVHVSERPPA